MRKIVLLAFLCLFGIEILQTTRAEKQIYGSLSSDCQTFTIYYGEKKNPADVTEWWHDFNTEYIPHIVLDISMKEARPTSTAYWFDGFRYAQDIVGLNYLNTSDVIDMNSMFHHCEQLTSVDISNFDTRKVTNMEYMFSGCYALTSLNLNSFKTENVTNMSWMFYTCKALPSLDLSGFNTKNVTTMKAMFGQCYKLATIFCNDDWSANTKLTDSDGMFWSASSLQGPNGTQYDSNNPTDVTYAHPDGGVDNPGYFTTTPKEIYTEFVEATGTLTYFFDNKKLSRDGIVEVYDPANIGLRFATYNEKILTAVIDESMTDAPLTSTRFLFCSGRTTSYPLKKLTTIKGLENLNTYSVTNMEFMFAMCQALESIKLSSFNTSNVTTMEGMFGECNKLKSLDLNSFNVAKLTKGTRMFYNCTELTTIYCKQDWRRLGIMTSSEDMFSGCTKLVGGEGTQCDGTNNIDLAYARPDDPENGKPGYFTIPLDEIYALYSADGKTLTLYYDDQYPQNGGVIEWWLDNTANAQVTTVMFSESMKEARPTSTAYWFGYFSNLQTITNFDYLNTSRVTDMTAMFFGCSALKTLDFTKFNTRNVSTLRLMFRDCTALKTIYCDDDWSQNTYLTNSQSMFADCKALVGGNGTTYTSANPNDASYAHPDEAENPGYFTKTTTTAINNQMVNAKCQNGKIIKNGQLYLLRNGKTYTVQGQEVK